MSTNDDNKVYSIRLPNDLILLIDEFRRDQDDLPSRSEAIRRILNDYFISTGKTPFEDDADFS
ncbi:ribbon-helix-helix CopG family protein [Maritalea mobilis]|uniref:Ribbon-helix-helix CopG family protein n=1 Tax=Maritalea mobilis TaxID=483324 RepID=A0A4R6VKF9_9HYPH|nr:ribbon-helix-helix CopG family protein [Maritalea mobilis]